MNRRHENVGTDRCVLRLWSVFGRMFKITNLRPSPRLHTMSAYSPRTLSADRSRTMFCVNSCLACPVSVSWSVCWISAGCICNGRKETAKIAKRLWPRRFSTAHPSARVACEGVSGFRNFVWIIKSSFEILLQKIGPRIQRKDTKFRKAIPLVIGLAITLRYLANGDLFVNFSSASFVFPGNKIYRVAFLITVFVSAQCTFHTLALDCQSTIQVRARVNRWNYADQLTTQRRKELRAQAVHRCRLPAVCCVPYLSADNRHCPSTVWGRSADIHTGVDETFDMLRPVWQQLTAAQRG
jgi:hypothetical protein